MTISTLIIFAQSKYGYFTATTKTASDYSYTSYVSDVIDLTKIDCSSTSKNTSMGYKKDLVNFYTDCGITWFKRKLENSNINPDNLINYLLAWKSDNGYNPKCTTKNESGCFYSKAEAEFERKKQLDFFKNMVEVH